MQLKGRLQRLERLAAPKACRACGLPLESATRSGPVKFVVSWWEPEESEEPPCRACGRCPAIRIELDAAG